MNIIDVINLVNQIKPLVKYQNRPNEILNKNIFIFNVLIYVHNILL